jgi:hypothetical protein
VRVEKSAVIVGGALMKVQILARGCFDLLGIRPRHRRDALRESVTTIYLARKIIKILRFRSCAFGRPLPKLNTEERGTDDTSREAGRTGGPIRVLRKLVALYTTRGGLGGVISFFGCSRDSPIRSRSVSCHQALRPVRAAEVSHRARLFEEAAGVP